MRIIILLSLLFTAAACQHQATTVAESATETLVAAPDRGGEVFGAEADFSEALSLAEITELLADTDTLKDVAVKGEVVEVCQAKGCWMTIQGEEEMMVKFKDYGFFMPKDIAGREVVMNGHAYYAITPVEELQHYAEDAGKSAAEIAAITAPKKELKFLAAGVLLVAKDEVAE